MKYEFEKDIVSFNQAIELCTLGFNEKTMCGYDIADRMLYICQVDEDGLYIPDKDIAAPTKSQVFRWFRGKYNYYGLIEGGYDNGCNLFTYVIWRESFDDCIGTYWNTYEQAEDACIDKLIELAKQKDND